jgi:hypothetical protein
MSAKADTDEEASGEFDIGQKKAWWRSPSTMVALLMCEFDFR